MDLDMKILLVDDSSTMRRITTKILNELGLKNVFEAKDGSVYYFNNEALGKLKEALPNEMHSLRLPISFYTSLDVSGNAYIADKPSFEALKHLGEFPKKSELVEGRCWLGKVLVLDMIKRWPTIIQFVRY